MGMYTELALNLSLDENVPQVVIDTLKYMLNNDNPKPPLPNHPLFLTDRWHFMLHSEGSYYFPGTHVGKLTEPDEIDNQRRLLVWTNIKNYSNEWEKFLDWIGQYCEKFPYPVHVGHYRYEESDLPLLIFSENKQLKLVPAEAKA